MSDHEFTIEVHANDDVLTNQDALIQIPTDLADWDESDLAIAIENEYVSIRIIRDRPLD